MLVNCYLGLGGNLKNPLSTIKQAIRQLSYVKGVCDLNVSRAYLTTPVSTIAQDPYINAVCYFKTQESPKYLFQNFCHIEEELGKTEKPKNAPRVIDIDFLFYGDHSQLDVKLTLPHPKVYERLFVLKPLYDLTPVLPLGHPVTGERDLKKILEEFENQNNEKVIPIYGRMY